MNIRKLSALLLIFLFLLLVKSHSNNDQGSQDQFDAIIESTELFRNVIHDVEAYADHGDMSSEHGQHRTLAPSCFPTEDGCIVCSETSSGATFTVKGCNGRSLACGVSFRGSQCQSCSICPGGSLTSLAYDCSNFMPCDYNSGVTCSGQVTKQSCPSSGANGFLRCISCLYCWDRDYCPGCPSDCP